MKTKFYAVCNSVGVCTIKDDDYKTQKAIFSEKEDAIKLVNVNSNDSDIHIKEIYIAEWDE